MDLYLHQCMSWDIDLSSCFWTQTESSALRCPTHWLSGWNLHHWFFRLSGLQILTGIIPLALLGLQLADCRSWKFLASTIIQCQFQSINHQSINRSYWLLIWRTLIEPHRKFGRASWRNKAFGYPSRNFCMHLDK